MLDIIAITQSHGTGTISGGTADLYDVAGTLQVEHGGTGKNTFTNGIVKVSGDVLSGVSTISLTSDIGGTLAVSKGGTGQTTFTNGIVKVSGDTFSGNSTISLATDVGGILPIANGGTGSTALPTLNNLSDVTITDISSSQMIGWNGTKWINLDPASVGAPALYVSATTGSPVAPTVTNFQGNVAIGSSAAVTSTGSTGGDLAIGNGATASGVTLPATAIGYHAIASNDNAVAIGWSNASGVNSTAIGIASSDGTYGAIAANATAIGYNSKASGVSSIAIGGGQATAAYSIALGYGAKSSTIGKYSFSGYFFANAGDSQHCRMLLRAATTNNTPSILTSDNSTASAGNQVILVPDQAAIFRGTVLVSESASVANNLSSWTIEGVIKQGANAAATTFVGTPSITLVAQDAALSGCSFTLTADTTLGGLAITATGANLNLHWLANVEWTEVVYA